MPVDFGFTFLGYVLCKKDVNQLSNNASKRLFRNVCEVCLRYFCLEFLNHLLRKEAVNQYNNASERLFRNTSEVCLGHFRLHFWVNCFGKHM